MRELYELQFFMAYDAKVVHSRQIQDEAIKIQ